MTPEQINELDETRPTLDDGNLLLVYLRTDSLLRAGKELERLTRRYDNPGIAPPEKARWRAWCAKAREYLDSVPQTDGV